MCYNPPNPCMDNDNDAPGSESAGNITLPPTARLPINHCNLPAAIVGSLTYQRHPVPLHIDGVRELHGDFLRQLDGIDSRKARARRFRDYMAVRFRLNALDDAGYDPASPRARPRADYRRMLRGWFFDSNGREGAVLKGWVESRFGLLTRFHRTALPSPDTEAYHLFARERAIGLYNTNALEAQLDLLYTFCQYELHRSHTDRHLTLFRGENRLEGVEKRGSGGRGRIVLLNNLSSFSASPERADEFGDRVLQARIPREKVAFHYDLLPDMFTGEQEYAVIGGLTEVSLAAW